MPNTVSQVLVSEAEPLLQDALEQLENEHTLAAMVLVMRGILWQLGVIVIEAVLAERSSQRTEWPLCPKCNSPFA